MDDTYFALYIDYLQLKNTKLIEHLNKNQDYCAKKSYNEDKGIHLDENLKYFNENRKDLQVFLILILPLSYMDQNIDFNDSRIFDECIGHCSIFYNKEKAILGIYGVCVHEHITKTKPAPKKSFLESILLSKGNVLLDYYTTFIEKFVFTFGFYNDNTPENDNLYSGWGSVLTDTLINSFIRFPANTILCLTVDIKNNDFEKAANLYIKYGFKNPYITDYDFSQVQYNDTLLVALSRQNFIDNYPTREERQEVYNNLLYVLDENKKCLKGKDNCELILNFDENIIKTLIRLPYVYYNYNPDGTNNYDNYKGVLKLDKVEYDLILEGYIWKVEIDNNLIQNNEGGVISFVSHSYASTLRDIRNSLPQGEDYAKLVELYIKFGTICYCVITNDGIFIISFKKTLKDITDNMIPYVIDKYSIKEITGEIILEDYVNKVNSLEIFDCKYLTWEQTLNNVVSINYPKFNGQCYPSIHVKKLIERLHSIYGQPNLIKNF